MIKFIRKYRVCFLYIVFILISFSCGKKFTEGEIVDKFYEPPRKYEVYVYDYTLGMRVTEERCDDEDFVFMVSNVIEGDTVTERFEVNSEDYHSFEVGDWMKLK